MRKVCSHENLCSLYPANYALQLDEERNEIAGDIFVIVYMYIFDTKHDRIMIKVYI